MIGPSDSGDPGHASRIRTTSHELRAHIRLSSCVGMTHRCCITYDINGGGQSDLACGDGGLGWD